MFAETKAHTKAIDLELRRLDILQANQHVLYLKSYMPETFMIRGGDYFYIFLYINNYKVVEKKD